MKGLVDHGKDFEFYSKTKRKPSEGAYQGSNTI